jgi:phosphate:Na+ symporter
MIAASHTFRAVHVDKVWVLFSTAGGLALFLYGLRVLSDALKRAIGDRMRSLLERLTGKAYRGAIVGALTSGTLQSSSMTMVLLIGLINAGALTLIQGIGVMLGSEIGTTITAQIIAFKVGHYYLPIVATGFLLSEIFHGKRAGDVGRIILGFGLLFLGISIVSGGLQGVTQSEGVLRLLQTCADRPLLGVLIGAGITAVIQSSSAMTALVIGMGAAGLLTLPAAIALILGANIGTTITAQIASIGSSLSSRRLAVTQLLVNVSGVCVFLPLVGRYAGLVSLTSPSLTRQIANAHTFFNVLVAIPLIPCVGGLVRIVTRLVPGRERDQHTQPQYLGEQFLKLPPIALQQARRELMRMGGMTVEMLTASRDALLGRGVPETSPIYETEETIDAFQDAIDDYLERIKGASLAAEDERRQHVFQHVVDDIERVGDQVVNIAQRADRARRNGYSFSKQAADELDDMFEQATALYRLSLRALQGEDREAAQQALEIEKDVDRLETEYKANHVRRLEEGTCDPEAGILFAEILHNLERIGDHAVNIAGDVLLI